VSEPGKILPRRTALSEPFWDGCRAGELRLQHCAACGRYQFYPRVVCSHCHAPGPGWRTVSGQGVIASFTVVRRGLSPAYPAPYAVALVDLAEGPRMMGSITGCEPGALCVGAPVAVRFENWGADCAVPVFHLTDACQREEDA
jgi:uncharacterized OB-fold protein